MTSPFQKSPTQKPAGQNSTPPSPAPPLATTQASAVPQLTDRQHFVFGYKSSSGEDRAFAFRQSPQDTWFVRYGRCLRPPGGFREECLRTARRIAELANAPIHVMFSGGADSEVALRSFHEAGVPVRAAILRFQNDLNLHDIAWAVNTCESLGIAYDFYHLDLLKFWESEALAYAEATTCLSPQLLPTMWLADQIPGYCVMGSGENYIVKRRPNLPEGDEYHPSLWDLYEKEKIASWYRHFIVRGRNACPGFFQFTPELMLSWLLDPQAQALWKDQCYRRLDSMSSKLAIYQTHFGIQSRPKYTGYERVADAEVRLRDELARRLPPARQIYKTPVPTLIQQLRPDPDRPHPASRIAGFRNSPWDRDFDPRELPPGFTHTPSAQDV